MADTKITGLAAAGALAVGDLLVVVDVSDTSMDAAGTDKKLTLDALGTFLGDPVLVLQSPGGVAASTAAGTYWWNHAANAVTASGSGSTSPPSLVVLNTADWPNIDNLELHVSLISTATQTGVTFTFGLYPVTIGGTTSPAYTLGTVVSGSTVAFVAPATTGVRGNSGVFTLPSADEYLIGLVTNATSAAASRVHFTATLKGHRA